MPGLNHTGPLGEGPRTGRKMGNCKPAPSEDAAKAQTNNEQLEENFGPGTGNRRRFRNQGQQPGMGAGRAGGRGRGRGRGLGRGMGR